jgi:diguanylate cyclase (GGDEF)-like protein/PAS domain S-box-containing protein
VCIFALFILPVTKLPQPTETPDESELGAERRFRTLTDAIPLIVWTTNANGELDYYNRQWEIYTGLTVEETKGWGWAPVLHPDDLQPCIDRWKKALATGELYEIEYRFKRAADGAYRWHLGRAIPLRDEAGTIIKWFGTGTDIDDQIRAKELVNEAYLDIENVVKQRTTALAIANQQLVQQNEISELAVATLQSDSARLNEIITAQYMLAKAELDLDAFIALVVERMTLLTLASGAVVEMVEGDEMVYRAAYGVLVPHVGLRLKMHDSLSGLCIDRHQVLIAQDTETDLRVNRAACRKINARSMVVAPLFHAGQPVGVLKIVGAAPHAFSERDVQTLQLMAGLIGAAIGHQADYEISQRLLAERTEAVAALLREIDHRILVEQTVSANELRTRKIIESSYDAFVAIDGDGVVIDWNQQAENTFGWLRQEAIGAVLAELIIPERYREAHVAGMKRFIACGASTVLNKPMELVGLRRSGQEFPLELTIRALQYKEREGYEFCAFLRDISDRKKAEERLLYLEKARAEIMLNSISDAVIGTDMTGKVDYLNVAAEVMTGWSRDEAYGHPIGQVMKIINGTTGIAERNPLEWVLQQNAPMGLNADSVLVRRDGSVVPIEDSAAPIRDAEGQISGAVMVFHDISAAQAMTMKMAHLAQHDFLTGLPNRLLLNDRIAQAIVLAERRNTQVAVLFLDLDNFKHINDSLGHVIGDELLQSVALRVSACVRSSDTVSRQGGDEFVVLVTEDKFAENAALTADKILTALAAPHTIDEHELHVTTSIGISVYPADGQNAETLIKNADTAMYQAKAKGRNNYQFFKSDMNVRAVERQMIESHLRHVLARGEFVLHYQAKVNLDSGRITGAEALLRWMHPDWGMVLPDRFVPIAEDCGLIVSIGRWVLREACMQAKRWETTMRKPVSIAVNISALEFRRKDFVEGVRTILSETGLAPACLQLEITESVLMRDAETSTAILHQLKAMGVRLAVDDFGTGYSSLSYLKQFPIDVLKIDQSFVHAVGAMQGDGIIVSAVIAMGNSLKQQVVAEGVEEAVQLAFLKQQNCEEGQGYLFARPLDADQFAALLINGIADSHSF